MKRLLLAGATGLVGQAVLRQALANPRIGQVIAPTRRAISAHPHLLNPLVDFDALPQQADWWQVDAVICTLGTTIRAAGSQEAFHKVDHDYPLAVARLARQHGASTYVLTSATGANSDSRVFYSRTKGELERDLQAMDYPSLTFVRPGLLGGEREQSRPIESLGMKLFSVIGPVLPRRYRVVAAEQVATCLLQAALGAKAGTHLIESEEIGRD